MRARISVLTASLFVLFAVFGRADCFSGDIRDGKIGSRDVRAAGMKAEWKIDAEYPVFGVPSMDDVLRTWVTARSAMIMDNDKRMADAGNPETILDVEIDY
jgi:hypothetical protein